MIGKDVQVTILGAQKRTTGPYSPGWSTEVAGTAMERQRKCGRPV